MQQRSIGKSGITASHLCFGCMQFGGTADEAASEALYEATRAAGINFFDNAWIYNEGRSEMLLGKLMEKEREKLIVTSKVANTGGASAKNIRSQAEESLRWLRSDYVDILFLHMFNNDPLEETFAELAKLKEEGKLRAIGVSNFAAWQVMKAQQVAASFDIRIDILQPMYNLVKRTAEMEILPMALDQDIAVIPYSPLGGGLLTGKYAKGASGRLTEVSFYGKRYGDEWTHEAAQNFVKYAADKGVHPATLAVAWTGAHPAITAPIISARSVEQLAPSLAADAFEMTAEIYAELSALTPAPPPPTDRTEGAHS